MYSRWFHEVEGDLRQEMKGLRWLLIRQEDLVKATSAWMFAELDGTLIGIDHRGVTVSYTHLTLPTKA